MGYEGLKLMAESYAFHNNMVNSIMAETFSMLEMCLLNTQNTCIILHYMYVQPCVYRITWESKMYSGRLDLSDTQVLM